MGRLEVRVAVPPARSRPIRNRDGDESTCAQPVSLLDTHPDQSPKATAVG